MCPAEYAVTEQQQSTMRRKTQAGRALHQSRTVSVLKALRLSLSKVGNDLFELPLATLGATQDIVGNDACTQVFQDDHLLILLDGPAGTRGAVMLDPVLVGGLIQQQTMGAVQPVKQDGPARVMTATDATLIEPMINMLLERAAPLPESEEERCLLTGFKFGAKAQDVRLLMLALDADEFHILRFTLDLAKGARQGELLFCLPVPPPPPKVAVHDPDDRENGTSGAGKTLCENVLTLKADLVVSLTQIQLSIRAAGALRVGQVLDLGMVSFDDAQVRTRQGRVLGRGVLGQQDGMRALRLKHRGKKRDSPQRRSSDRGDLAEERPQDMQFDDFYSVQDLPALTDVGPRNPELSDLGLLDNELADAGPAGGMSNPDLNFDNTPMPDMSDLPGFEEDKEDGADAISRLKTG
jgi:flagellar motor switch protein FliM